MRRIRPRGRRARRIEDRLHAARRTIEAELVAIALEDTSAEHGALFVWDKEADGLMLVHHVVGGVTVTLPRVVKHDGPKAGIALHVFDEGEPYLSPTPSRDPRYTRYLIDVGCDRRGADPLPAPADRRAHGLDARAARPRATATPRDRRDRRGRRAAAPPRRRSTSCRALRPAGR